MSNQRVGAYAPLFFLVSFCVCGIILLILSVNLSMKLDACMCDSDVINWSNRVVFILGMIITTATLISIFYNIGGIRAGLQIKNIANFYKNYGIVLAVVGTLVTSAGIAMIVKNYTGDDKQTPKDPELIKTCPGGVCKTGTLGWIISITVFGAIIFGISMFMIFYNQKMQNAKAQAIKSDHKGVLDKDWSIKKPQGPTAQKEKAKEQPTQTKSQLTKKAEYAKKILDALEAKLPKAPTDTIEPGMKKKIIATTKELNERLEKLKNPFDETAQKLIRPLLKRSKTIEEKLEKLEKLKKE
jgi:hypothetical protein